LADQAASKASGLSRMALMSCIGSARKDGVESRPL